jgi:1-phosphofructokinase/6-phosphofructokinase 2
MIITLTPNPSIDRTVAVPVLEHGEVNRATSSRLDPGGKGVNVSRALTANAAETVAVMPSGGPEGHLMEELLETAGVRRHLVPVAGGTLRMNVAVVEPDGTTTKVNEPGPTLDVAECESLLAAVESYAAPGAWVVGCGSLPPGAPATFLADLVRRGHDHGLTVAIDSSGAPMPHAIAAGPDLIKPNHEELEEIVGRPLPTLGAVVEAARGLVASGIARVVVSLGGDGAVFVDADTVAHAVATIERPVSTVGAGDCLLAGVLQVLAAGGSATDALLNGVRWGAAAVTLPGSQVPGPDDLAAVSVTLSDDLEPARAIH